MTVWILVGKKAALTEVRFEILHSCYVRLSSDQDFGKIRRFLKRRTVQSITVRIHHPSIVGHAMPHSSWASSILAVNIGTVTTTATTMTMMTQRFHLFRVLVAFCFFLTDSALAFTSISPPPLPKQPALLKAVIKNHQVLSSLSHSPLRLHPLVAPLRNSNSSDDDEETTSTTASNAAKLSLEEKMKSWEATEEEIKASTLGGVIPKSMKSDSEENANRSDAFDVGLYIAFPIMVLSGLALVAFPFFMGSLDVSNVGPPPTS